MFGSWIRKILPFRVRILRSASGCPHYHSLAHSFSLLSFSLFSDLSKSLAFLLGWIGANEVLIVFALLEVSRFVLLKLINLCLDAEKMEEYSEGKTEMRLKWIIKSCDFFLFFGSLDRSVMSFEGSDFSIFFGYFPAFSRKSKCIGSSSLFLALYWRIDEKCWIFLNLEMWFASWLMRKLFRF